jgi:hypothetical protein
MRGKRGRPNTSGKQAKHIGTFVEPHLLAAFDYLCGKRGVTRSEGFLRLLITAVRNQDIPGTMDFDYNFTFEENAAAPFAHTKPNSGDIPVKAEFES